ncbi:hypothetical protein HN587_04465 [Candidatus Woesearchaeota archaeon]|jgi:hypothetical protein|nr:hypothetical protein [Candidatus Woesearchaeota archaeon]
MYKLGKIMVELKQFTITKKVAKHGKQAIIVVPKLLEDQLPPGTIVEVKLIVIKEVKDDC